jgi:hypothetical protein
MKTFYVGYREPLDDFLTEFRDSYDADYNSEEWVEIEAETLEEAKSKYEESFIKWQNKL